MNRKIIIESIMLVFCIFNYMKLASSVDNSVLKFLNDCTSNNCKCTTGNSENTIECPANNPKIKIALSKVTPTDLLIQCYKPVNNDFLKILPILNIETKKQIKIVDCLLQENLSYSSMLQKMTVTNFIWLEITSEKIEFNITKQYLSGLKGLTSLRYDASTHYDTLLPEDLFFHESLTKLTSVILHTRNCKLSKNMFTNLENLTHMEISGIKLFATEIFRNQRQLRDLIIVSSSLQNGTKYVFEILNALNLFVLKESTVTDPDVLELLHNAKYIFLLSNNIFPLPEFKNNKFIKDFKMRNNGKQIKRNIPSKMLAELSQLEGVDISECGLQTIPEFLFVDSTNLKCINISANSLEILPDNLLATQHGLTELDVSYNNLEYFTDVLLRNAVKLNKLNLSHNKLLRFTVVLKHHSLMELHLQNNNLKDENIQFEQFYARYLDISNNRIKDIMKYIPVAEETLKATNNYINFLNVGEICVLFKAKNFEIDLSFNQIRNINFEGVEACSTPLKQFIVNNNPLHCECDAVLNLRHFLTREKDPQLLKRLNFVAYNVSCESPSYLRGINLANSDPMKIVCVLDETKCPNKCICLIRPHDNVLIVNCSNSQLTSIPVLPAVETFDLKELELVFENNGLKELPFNDVNGYANVTKLFLAGNSLQNIVISQLPTNLIYLDIRKNRFKILNENTIRFLNASNNSLQVYLSDNLWICDCNKKEMMNVILSNTLRFLDSSKMECDNKPKYKYLNYLQDACANQKIFYITLASILFGFFLILATLTTFYYKYQEEIKVWLYAHNMCLWFVTENELDRNRLYDAFISYSSKDEDFIYNHLLPELENGVPPFKICFYDRDWLIGECIPDAIINSITNSRRTIVVLSKNFIESVWAKMEFKTAHRSALNEGRSRLIVIIYGDIGDIDSLDQDLKAYLTMNIYLKWGEPKFWSKLRYAMPHTLRIRNHQENIPLREYINEMLE